VRPPVLEVPPPAPPPAPQPAAVTRWGLAGVLFVLTLISTTVLGVVWNGNVQPTTDQLLGDVLTAFRLILEEPGLLGLGLSYSLPLLFILLAHELGHYLACRYYRLPATLPYFIPAPFGLGTLGAFIKIKAPIRTKHQLFDVGVAGPLAGFIALLPFLLYGVAHSEPVTLEQVAADSEPVLILGWNLALSLLVGLIHGDLPAAAGLDLHPFALAGWVGMLATALNLIPLGQLDGGHILYAAVGARQRRLVLPLWAALGLAGVLWPGWLIWCLVTLFLGLFHPPVYDEATVLSPRRRILALVTLAIFLLCFMPVPLTVAFIE
jgi:membrane-associated protease RseP (regulator of RpoE activity)